MKKILLTLAIALGASAALSAQTATRCNADNATCERRNATSTECCTAPCPFEGLNLTAEQQSQIDQLKAQCRQQRGEGRQEAREQATANRLQARRDMLQRIKAILTPEQYVTFLENNFVNGPQRPEMRPGETGRHERQPHHNSQHRRRAAAQRTTQNEAQAR